MSETPTAERADLWEWLISLSNDATDAGEYDHSRRFYRIAELLIEGWRPIATAPKDGTSFIAWVDKYARPSLARWRGGKYRWEREETELDICGYWSGYPPTHWTPLPSPPSVRKATQDGER